MIVNEIGIGSAAIVDVIEPVGDVSGDLHTRDPGGEYGEIRVFGVPEAVGEIDAGDVVVDEVGIITGERDADEFDEAAVMAPAYEGESTAEIMRIDRRAELPLEDDDVLLAEVAAPGGGGGR